MSCYKVSMSYYDGYAFVLVYAGSVIAALPHSMHHQCAIVLVYTGSMIASSPHGMHMHGVLLC
jgi:hypothetical protein